MSKNLIIMRHAEALDNSFGSPDYDRILSKKGIQDIKEISKSLIAHHLQPELIIASSAKRTTQTAQILAESINFKEENIRFKKSLYNSTAQQILSEICSTEIPEAVQTLLVIAHNPGISELAIELVSLPTFINLPPCGIMAFRLSIENWTEYPFNQTEILLQQFPINY